MAKSALEEYMGDNKTEKKAEKQTGPKTYDVKVRRVLTENENRNDPIIVNTGSKDTGGRRVFYPNQPVALTETQIRILQTAIEESKITIPDHGGDSAIYNAVNPIEAAKEAWPGFEIRRDSATGVMEAIRNEAVYSIEFVGQSPF